MKWIKEIFVERFCMRLKMIKNKNYFKLYLIEISMIEGIIYFLFNEI